MASNRRTTSRRDLSIRVKPIAQPHMPVHEEALCALIRTGGLLKRVIEPRMATFGLSPAQWGVLRSLHRQELAGLPEPRVAELGSLLLVQPPSLSATLDRMERVGLVVRANDDRDHRTRLVRLTSAGRDLVEHALLGHSEWVAGVMAGLNPSEQATMLALLNKLGTHLTAATDARVDRYESTRTRTRPRSDRNNRSLQ